MNTSRKFDPVNGSQGGFDPRAWTAETAMRFAASRTGVDIVIERDPARIDAPHIRICLQNNETRVVFATLPLTAANADSCAVVIVAALSLALESREAVGLDGPIMVRVSRDKSLGKFDPIVESFMRAYERTTSDQLERVDRPIEGNE